MSKTTISLAIRDLIEIVMSSGDLVVGFIGRSRAVQGTKIHKKIQKSRPDDYHAEFSISHIFEFEKINIKLGGRIDGLYERENPIIEEIKSTSQDLDVLKSNPNQQHLAQLKIYAYIYCLQNNLENILTHLTYCSVDNFEIEIIETNYSFVELEEFAVKIINDYAKFISKVEMLKLKRNISMEKLQFPFEFRKYQKLLASKIYTSIIKEKNLYLNAPTGIGKTMGSIFPALKTFYKANPKKIFYLTARNTGKSAPLKAFKILKSANPDFYLRYLDVTSKDNICFQEVKNCNPDYCKYARNFFDKLKVAMEFSLQENEFTREKIEEIAQKFEICPFELSLELSLFCDFIMIDYNYVFDPRASLKRYFDGTKQEFILLIDESHHLPDRTRSMYSLSISKKNVLKYRRELKSHKTIYKLLSSLNTFLLNEKKIILNEHEVLEEPPKLLIKKIRQITNYIESMLEANRGSVDSDLFLEIYFEFLAYLKLNDLFDEQFVFYYSKNKRDFSANIFCLDPSKQIINKSKTAISKIMFSATLYPINYFQKLTGYNEDTDEYIAYESPFPINNQKLIIDKSVKTTYRERDKYYHKIGMNIKTYLSTKSGNYMIFFPSFKFLHSVYESCDWAECDIILQNNKMSNEERSIFIDNFTNDSAKVGFVVMGGVFAEGIDLIGKRLIGAIVVGVGLPQMSFENNLIKDYFADQNENGFAFAYQFPGFNKVLQSAGRVIRTETDLGVIILMDERFDYYYYRKMYPHNWQQIGNYSAPEKISKNLLNFWK